MIRVDSVREFRLVKDSFSNVKKINLKKIGFDQISNSNLYIYQSDEYKILNYSIKPELIFSINSDASNININLQSISISNLPMIFKRFKLDIEVRIFPEKELCKVNRYISLKYENKNKLIAYASDNFIDKIFKNLIEIISKRFDKKLIKKVLNAI